MGDEQKSVNSDDVAKTIGLDTITCAKCGGKMPGLPLIRRFFEEIVKTCRSGAKVRVMGFGIFEAIFHAARTIHSPLMKEGEIKSKDQYVLSFRQSPGSKRLLNPETTEESQNG